MKDSKENVFIYETCIEYRGYGLKLWSCLLLSLITSMVNILSTTSLNVNQTSTVFIVFIGVLIVMYTVYLYGAMGIAVAMLSSILFCLSINLSFYSVIINIFANTIQAFIIWIIFKFTNINKYAIENYYGITDYKCMLFIIGILHIVFGLIFEKFFILYLLAGFLFICAFYNKIIMKRTYKIKFLFLLCVLPSFISSIINSLFGVFKFHYNFTEWYNIFITWFLSNTILFNTFGYILLNLFPKANEKYKSWKQNKISLKISYKSIDIKLSSIFFYTAAFCWNIFFYIIYMLGWLQPNTFIYLFPWFVGNVFFF